MNESAGLASQLAEDGVAFHGVPEDPVLQERLREVLGDGTGFIVAGPGVGNHRDFAEDVRLHGTGMDTLIVRSPESAAVVSDTYSRASIEATQHHLFVEPDYVLATESFLRDVSGFSVPWTIVVIVALVVLAGAATWTIRSVRS